MRNRKYSKQEEGFTLFLVSILLVIAAMAAATVLQQSNRDQFWNAKTETQKRIQKVVAALEAYQRENHKLPCVASRTAVVDTAEHGSTLNVDPAECSAAAVTGDTIRLDNGSGVMVRIGAVPYKALQIQQIMQEDKWGNKLLYAVTEPLTDDDFYMSQTGGITVNDADGVETSTAAFVVLSHGPDAVGAYRNRTGTIYPACSAAAGLAQENCDDDATFRQNSLETTAGATFYDDQLLWEEVDAIAQTSP